MNQDGATICKGCGAALVANPCLEVDHQIAINLQQKEERDALEDVQNSERKRKQLPRQSLLDQAQELVSELEKRLSDGFHIRIPSRTGGRNSKRPKPLQESRTGNFLRSTFCNASYELIPSVDLTISASQFLDCARQRCAQEGAASVFLAYMFTSKAKYRAVQFGGGHSARVLTSSPDDAFQYWKEYVYPNENSSSSLPGPFDHRPGSASLLSTIGEEQKHEDVSCHQKFPDRAEMAAVGWIVALAPGREERGDHFTTRHSSKATATATTNNASTATTNGNGSDNVNNTEEAPQNFNVTTVKGQGSHLPLVCFDAMVRNHLETTRLFMATEQLFLDFMQSVGVHTIPTTTSTASPLEFAATAAVEDAAAGNALSAATLHTQGAATPMPQSTNTQPAISVAAPYRSPSFPTASFPAKTTVETAATAAFRMLNLENNNSMEVNNGEEENEYEGGHCRPSPPKSGDNSDKTNSDNDSFVVQELQARIASPISLPASAAKEEEASAVPTRESAASTTNVTEAAESTIAPKREIANTRNYPLDTGVFNVGGWEMTFCPVCDRAIPALIRCPNGCLNDNDMKTTDNDCNPSANVTNTTAFVGGMQTSFARARTTDINVHDGTQPAGLTQRWLANAPTRTEGVHDNDSNFGEVEFNERSTHNSNTAEKAALERGPNHT